MLLVIVEAFVWEILPGAVNLDFDNLTNDLLFGDIVNEVVVSQRWIVE